MTVDRHRARFQRGLVVAQVAVSLVLVFSALLFVQTFRNLAAVTSGFEPERHDGGRVLGSRVDALPAERKVAFQEQLTSEIATRCPAWPRPRRRRTCR